MFYDPGSDWKFGAAVKSPQWFRNLHVQFDHGRWTHLSTQFDLDFPMVVSVGTAYTGFEQTLIALDLRFFDFRGTNGFRHAGFNPDGSVAGLGWQNVFALATGVQYELTDALTLRAGTPST